MAGSIKGVRARGGFELDIEWKAGKLSKATVRNINGNICKIRYGSKLIELSVEPGNSVILNGDLIAQKN
ncbi:MAG: hypothetical protein Q7T72_01990 [Bacteroidales bacterium]|nr:hypothetical protein [Bacteroidales bacterium]MDP3003617.1 hypothetical protein [Bacteroidales bacterium]